MTSTTRRVLHVTTFSMVNPWLTDLVTRLPIHGWEPVVITLEPEGALHEVLRAAGLRALALGSRSRRDYPRALVRLAAAARQVSIIHAHLLDAVILSTVIGSLVRRPVVITRHESPGSMDFVRVPRVKRALYHVVEGQLLRRAAAVIAPSRLAQDEVVARGARHQRVHRILLGADMRRLGRADPVKGRIARERLAPPDGFVALFVGRFSPEKRADVLEHAWQRVLREHPNGRIVLVGDGPERAALRMLAEELGIAHAVSFLGWRSDVPELMLAADLVVHPSATESTGIVLLEALALARPLVVTPVGIVNEYLVDGVHCRVVPHGDADALAQAILDVVADPVAAAARAIAGRDLVMQRSAIEPMVAAYARVYDQLMEATKRIMTSASSAPR